MDDGDAPKQGPQPVSLLAAFEAVQPAGQQGAGVPDRGDGELARDRGVMEGHNRGLLV